MKKLKRYFYHHRPYSYISIILCMLLVVFINQTIYQRNRLKHHITSVSFFGEEVVLKPNLYIYDINLKNATIKAIGNGCETPYVIELDKQASTYDSSAQGYLVEGEYQGYFKYNICNWDEKTEKETCLARYIFNIKVDTPIIDECN